jgi:hypothetical protein
MNSRYQSFILILFVIAALVSCGGTGGAPGSDIGDTSIMIQSVTLTRESRDIDTVQNCCAVDANGACSNVEVFTRDAAVMNIKASNLSENITEAHFPASVEECTITYYKANEDPAAPIIEKLTIYPNCTLLKGDNSCDVDLIDITRKYQYSTPVFFDQTSVPAEQPTHYVARYTCRYVNNFGKSGSFQVEIDLWLSDFDNC